MTDFPSQPSSGGWFEALQRAEARIRELETAFRNADEEISAGEPDLASQIIRAALQGAQK